MSMIAIRISEENFEAMHAQNKNFTREDLDEMLMKDAKLNEKHYFVPFYTSVFNVPFHNWVAMRSDFFEESFEYDRERIETEFVEITRKP